MAVKAPPYRQQGSAPAAAARPSSGRFVERHQFVLFPARNRMLVAERSQLPTAHPKRPKPAGANSPPAPYLAPEVPGSVAAHFLMSEVCSLYPVVEENWTPLAVATGFARALAR